VILFELTSKAITQPEEPLAVSITDPDAKKTVFVPFTFVITSELRCFRIALAKRRVPLLASASETGGTTRVPSAMSRTHTCCIPFCGVPSGEIHATRYTRFVSGSMTPVLRTPQWSLIWCMSIAAPPLIGLPRFVCHNAAPVSASTPRTIFAIDGRIITSCVLPSFSFTPGK
jgi:hypothetical protein